jgi:hypothetical protein
LRLRSAVPLQQLRVQPAQEIERSHKKARQPRGCRVIFARRLGGLLLLVKPGANHCNPMGFLLPGAPSSTGVWLGPPTSYAMASGPVSDDPFCPERADQPKGRCRFVMDWQNVSA